MTEPNDNNNINSPSTTTTTTTPIAATATVSPAAAPKKSVVDDFFSALFANNSHSQPAAAAAAAQAVASAAPFTSTVPSQANVVNHSSNNDSPAVETSSEIKIEAPENNISQATPTITGRSTTTTLASLQQLPAAAIQAIGSSVNHSASAAIGQGSEDNDSSNQAQYKAEIDSLVNRSRNYPQYRYNDIDQQAAKDENNNEDEDDDEEDNDQYDDAQDNNQEDDNDDMEQINNHNHQARNGVKRERQVLDEFDEYSLLSSKRGRRGSSPAARNQRNNRNVRGPRIEARDIIMSVNNRNGSVDNDQDEGNNDDHDEDDETDSNGQNERPQILAKREIDWSSVVPESRMLVRSLPKYINKQDVMDYFSKYGEVLEVVQKSPFGFVHFENPESCAQAVQVENGKLFKGVVLDLEICKRKPFFARAAEREALRESAPVSRNQSGGQYHQQRNQGEVAAASGFQYQQQAQDYQQVPRTVEYNAGRRNSNERNYERPGRSGYNISSLPPHSRNSSIAPRGADDVHRRDSDGYKGNNNVNDYNRPSYGRNNNNQGYGGPRGGRNDNDRYGGNSRYNNNNDGYGVRRNNNNNQDMNPGGYNSGYNSGRNNYNDRNNAPVGGGGYNSSRYNNDPVDNGRNYSQYNDNNANNYSRYNNNNDNYGSRRGNNNNSYGSNARVPSAPAPVAAPAPVIPPRQGNQVPLVQIIAWDNVAFGFTDYIERVFSTNHIRASSITLPFSLSTREQIVQQMIMEGVKAIVMIDRRNENLNKVYLQVFLPNEYGQTINYDEYSSITAIEAVTIVNRTYPAQAQFSPVVANQYQQQQQAYQQVPPTPQQAPVLHQQPATSAAQPAVDLNTLASLYSAIVAPAQQQAAAPAVQPNVQQLLATLVNNLSVQQAAPQQQQPNIAALLSTAAGGNPALAQLLAQVAGAGGNSNGNASSNQQQGQGHPGYSPSMPNNQIDKNNTD